MLRTSWTSRLPRPGSRASQSSCAAATAASASGVSLTGRFKGQDGGAGAVPQLLQPVARRPAAPRSPCRRSLTISISLGTSSGSSEAGRGGTGWGLLMGAQVSPPKQGWARGLTSAPSSTPQITRSYARMPSRPRMRTAGQAERLGQFLGVDAHLKGTPSIKPSVGISNAVSAAPVNDVKAFRWPIG
jgi:hypothetical protein